MKNVRIKRIYEPLEKEDGFRVLVDRLWPRGIKKENAQVEVWLKSVAPTTKLRKWFGHDPEKWKLFQEKYKAELKKDDAVNELISLVNKHQKITLVYGAKDEQHNHAVVLQQLLQ